MTLNFDQCPVLVHYQHFWVVGEIHGDSEWNPVCTAIFWGRLGTGGHCDHYELSGSRGPHWYQDIVQHKLEMGHRRTSAEISEKVLNLIHEHMVWNRLTTE